MAEQAIILIPDISGFTRFTTATETDHAAHIITELLKIIVASNEAGFTLGEIEGDAVLFYRKGEPLRREQLIDQCLYIFSNFHRQLEVMERDRVCQCGACQTASNLTLKFIAHAIVHAFNPSLLGAMGAAVDLALRFGAVADHPTFAVRASGGHGVDGALKAVECHLDSSFKATPSFPHLTVFENVAFGLRLRRRSTWG